MNKLKTPLIIATFSLGISLFSGITHKGLIKASADTVDYGIYFSQGKMYKGTYDPATYTYTKGEQIHPHGISIESYREAYDNYYEEYYSIYDISLVNFEFTSSANFIFYFENANTSVYEYANFNIRGENNMKLVNVTDPHCELTNSITSIRDRSHDSSFNFEFESVSVSEVKSWWVNPLPNDLYIFSGNVNLKSGDITNALDYQIKNESCSYATLYGGSLTINAGKAISPDTWNWSKAASYIEIHDGTVTMDEPGENARMASIKSYGGHLTYNSKGYYYINDGKRIEMYGGEVEINIDSTVRSYPWVFKNYGGTLNINTGGELRFSDSDSKNLDLGNISFVKAWNESDESDKDYFDIAGNTLYNKRHYESKEFVNVSEQPSKENNYSFVGTKANDDFSDIQYQWYRTKMADATSKAIFDSNCSGYFDPIENTYVPESYYDYAFGLQLKEGEVVYLKHKGTEQEKVLRAARTIAYSDIMFESDYYKYEYAYDAASFKAPADGMYYFSFYADEPLEGIESITIQSAPELLDGQTTQTLDVSSFKDSYYCYCEMTSSRGSLNYSKISDYVYFNYKAPTSTMGVEVYLDGEGNVVSSVSNPVVGDIYINVETFDVFKYTETGWVKIASLIGNDGQDGQPGANGTSFLSGTSDPTAADGNEGDLYINTTSGDIFTKGSTGWTKVGNLKGANGNDGQDGQPGTNGQDGVNGQNGVNGQDGKDGTNLLGALIASIVVNVAVLGFVFYLLFVKKIARKDK